MGNPVFCRNKLTLAKTFLYNFYIDYETEIGIIFQVREGYTKNPVKSEVFCQTFLDPTSHPLFGLFLIKKLPLREALIREEFFLFVK